MSTTTAELIAAGQRYYLPVYRPRNIVLDHGRGSRVWDRDGREYVDFSAGIAVSALGHAAPELVAALTSQAGKLWHTSNIFWVAENTIRFVAKGGQDLMENMLILMQYAKRACAKVNQQ